MAGLGIIPAKPLTTRRGMHENYQGPGIYEHYKGGHYIVLGKVRLEWNNGEGVAYMTLDREHQRENFYEDVLFVVRPLNQADGEDCWNSMVVNPNKEAVAAGLQVEYLPRFAKIA
jgi:hypothetical protein